MAPTLYVHLLSPPCRAVLLTAKTMGLDMKIEQIDTIQKQQLEPSFLKMNPAHTVPTLVDNDLCMWESRAIMCYLVSKYGKDDKLYPKDVKQRAHVDKMLYWDADTLYSSMSKYVYLLLAGKTPTEEDIEKIKSNIKIFDNILAASPFAAGKHMTIADITLVLTVTGLEPMGMSYSDHPNINRWVQKMKKELGVHYNEFIESGLVEFKKFIDAKKAELGKK